MKMFEEDAFEKMKAEYAQSENGSSRSLVQVYFPAKQAKYSYYNDRFALKTGDFVYVEGKLEGVRGIVTDVSYNFKIKISQYKRVIAFIDTEVHGKFYMAGSYFAVFDRCVLPKEKAITWFKPPESEDEEYISSTDDSDSFSLYNLNEMKISEAVAERGQKYYFENRVRYISLDGTKGYAIVEGTEGYEIEFTYENKKISNLICSCFCSGYCKHEFATMLQLREMLDWMEVHCYDEYQKSAYFAAISKETLFDFSVARQREGSILF